MATDALRTAGPFGSPWASGRFPLSELLRSGCVIGGALPPATLVREGA